MPSITGGGAGFSDARKTGFLDGNGWRASVFSRISRHLWRRKTGHLCLREWFMRCSEMKKGGKMSVFLKKLDSDLKFLQIREQN